MFGPNIIGNAGSWPAWSTTTGTEAMIVYQSSNSARISGGNGSMVSVSLGFNAAKVDATYGRELGTIRPSSTAFYVCIRF